jgi:hypothetical protein
MFNGATKRRYQDPRHPRFDEVTSWGNLLRGSKVYHHVLNLFELHRAERQRWSGRVAQTERYRAWVARRDET